MLPRTHGSALFTRGETQALVTVTLGTGEDVQRLDDLMGESSKRFMLHYNFPPFSVGEVRFLRGPGRREIGHGALAERALRPVLPPESDFPYTIRVVSDILESNGSSSMASVCGGVLALQDAGVPLKSPVAGVAMGLVKEGDRYAVLSDIAGLEDHYGDMDFKVAGTTEGITALQMDIKITGVTREIMSQALAQAREGRIHILTRMADTIPESRPAISRYAPQIITISIPIEKIGAVIGPGGKMIRSIVEETGAKIDIEDDGTVKIASTDGSSAEKAMARIEELTAVPQVGRTYLGKVVKVVEFGAFVEILPGTEGLLHISEIADRRIRDIRQEVHTGDKILVKVLDIDNNNNRIRLSRRAVLQEQRKENPASQG
jgi:polyribonucleotide nucleotidyltransferase